MAQLALSVWAVVALAVAFLAVPTGALQWGVGLLNLASAGCFVFDKLLSKAGSPRIPEAVLHVMALLGGPGACLARYAVRHKTLKPAFGLSTFLGLLVLSAVLAVVMPR